MHDHLRQAYATLGLPQGASLRTIKARRKALVRRWHPDRFQNDPVGQAEATERMRAINDAYRTVVDSLPRRRASAAMPRADFASVFPPRDARTPVVDTRLDKIMRFCLGAILAGLSARRVVVLLSPADDLVAAILLALPAVAVGLVSAIYGDRFLDWLAEPPRN